MIKAHIVYETVTEEFTERLLEKLDGQVESVILYGSVARGEGGSGSDIDILVLGERKADWKTVSQIAYEIDSQNNNLTLLSPTFYTTSEFEENALRGSFFVRRVLREGVVLHDKGGYKRIRDKIVATG